MFNKSSWHWRTAYLPEDFNQLNVQKSWQECKASQLCQRPWTKLLHTVVLKLLLALLKWVTPPQLHRNFHYWQEEEGKDFFDSHSIQTCSLLPTLRERWWGQCNHPRTCCRQAIRRISLRFRKRRWRKCWSRGRRVLQVSFQLIPPKKVWHRLPNLCGKKTTQRRWAVNTLWNPHWPSSIRFQRPIEISWLLKGEINKKWISIMDYCLGNISSLIKLPLPHTTDGWSVNEVL